MPHTSQKQRVSVTVDPQLLIVRNEQYNQHLERGPYGEISPESLEQIQRGIQMAIDMF